MSNEIKYCEDCAHCIAPMKDGKPNYGMAKCAISVKPHADALVTRSAPKELYYCSTERISPGESCGAEANHFQPKTK